MGVKDRFFISLTAKDEQRVKLSLGELFSSATYSTEGKVSSRRIEADFGRVGRVDLKIHLHPGGSEPPLAGDNCSGRPPLEMGGTYHGILEFSGEREIPALRSKHGRVVFIRRFRRVCRKPVPPFSHGKKVAKSRFDLGLLAVEGHGEGRTSQFLAVDLASRKTPAISFGIVFGATHERLEQVLIDRSTLNFAGGEELTMSRRGKDPETFKVQLEKPFVGKAVFSRVGKVPPSWRGDLSVRLPGARPAPLTGPAFSAELCRASAEAQIAACVDELGGLSRPSTSVHRPALASIIAFRNDFLSHLLDMHR